MSWGNNSHILKSSGALTTAWNSSPFFNKGWRGCVLIVDITVLGSTNIVASLEATHRVTNTYVTMHTLTTMNLASTWVIEIYPGVTAGTGPTNEHFAHSLPERGRFTLTPNNANSNTYSVSVHWLV